MVRRRLEGTGRARDASVEQAITGFTTVRGVMCGKASDRRRYLIAAVKAPTVIKV